MATGALLSTSRVAFAFDIDGTLTRGSIAIPEASSPLLYLQQNNIPFILLTNAGGATEAAKASALSQILNVPLSPDQVVQGHTPFSALVDGPEQLRHKPVLVIGDDPTGDGPRVLARSYGFEQVITPNDILAAFPTLLSHPHSYALNNVQALPKDSKIAAIFIFTKPADWAPVLQIIMDLLLSCGGQLGTLSPKNGDMELPNSGYLQDGQPKIHISNSDMTFMADYALPRFGTGSFRAALEGTWNGFTGEDVKLDFIEYGKPTQACFAFAEEALEKWRREQLGLQNHQVLPPLKTVFMVGDSPISDIRGANEYVSKNGTTWASVLVKTGLWDGKTKLKDTPSVVVETVKEAVEYGVSHEDYQANVLDPA